MKRILMILSVSGLVFAQVKPPAATVQQAGSCSVLVNGSNNSIGSLTCTDIDRRLAEQMRMLINSTKGNTTLLKEISDKLDRMRKELDKPTVSITQFNQGSSGTNIAAQTVSINQRPKARRIPRDRWDELKAVLAPGSGQVRVSSVQNNREAYDFAQDWYDLLKEAGWTMLDDKVRFFLLVGPPEPGVLLRLHGESVPSGGRFEVASSSAAGRIASVLDKIGLGSQRRGLRFQDMPEGQISLEISEVPE